MNKTLTRLLQATGIIVLLLWMIIALVLVLHFSQIGQHLIYSGRNDPISWSNYIFFFTDHASWPLLLNTVLAFTLIPGLFTIQIRSRKPVMSKAFTGLNTLR